MFFKYFKRLFCIYLLCFTSLTSTSCWEQFLQSCCCCFYTEQKESVHASNTSSTAQINIPDNNNIPAVSNNFHQIIPNSATTNDSNPNVHTPREIDSNQDVSTVLYSSVSSVHRSSPITEPTLVHENSPESSYDNESETINDSLSSQSYNEIWDNIFGSPTASTMHQYVIRNRVRRINIPMQVSPDGSPTVQNPHVVPMD